MYAPVSRQLDAPVTATFSPGCASSGAAAPRACQPSAPPAGYQKTRYVQTVQPAPGYAAEAGVPGKLEGATSSLPMILIAAALLLIPAVAMGFFSNARWPGLLRG